MPKANKEVNSPIVIEELSTETQSFWVMGTSPLIYNSISAKVRGELLFPKGRKTTVEKTTSMKHNPLEEYRNSVYRRIGAGPTRLTLPTIMFKNGVVSTCRHVETGTNMTQLKQLIWVNGERVDIYGVPQMFMTQVRMADKARTPDIRTRAILPQWCGLVSLRFICPNLNVAAITKLLSAAGILSGVGDFRQEKGKANYGQYEVVNQDQCQSIIDSGGLEAQDAALENPGFYDLDTEELYKWFLEERVKRGK